MAKKGQKFRKYPEELKQKVLDEYYSGKTGHTELSRKYGIPYETIHNWINKINNPWRYPVSGQRRGRPKDSETDWKQRYEILKKYRAFLKAQRERK